MSTSPAPRKTRSGTCSVLQVDSALLGLVNIGVLLRDTNTDTLHLRLRRDLEVLSEDEDLEVLSALAEDLKRKAGEKGAGQLLGELESSLSNALRITDREEVVIDDFNRALDRLYRKNVQSNVLEFRTHLPRYSLRAAAGIALENQEIAEEGWIEAPENLRLTRDMFVAQIVGHSMEPLIPDGSLCVFRYGVVGSRTGRLVLAEELGAAGNNRYAVKQYARAPGKLGEPVPLHSLNPEYPDWELKPDEDKYRIIAEFVRVLD
jgi:SOS-response transcriptional repressor LexA